MVIWKAAVPILAVIVIMSLSFHTSNFTAGGGFAPYGAHGIFAALPAGVVFALQGFEQAVQMGGEARNPKKDISRAIISAMFIGAAVYILLEVAFIGGLSPQQPRARLAEPDRRRRLRSVLHDRARRRRRLAGHDPAGRCRHLARRHRPDLPRHVRAAVLRAGRGRGHQRQADRDEQARRPGVVDRPRVRHRRDHVPAVPELELARRPGDRRDGDHVRLRAGLTRGAAPARSRPPPSVPRARSRR